MVLREEYANGQIHIVGNLVEASRTPLMFSSDKTPSLLAHWNPATKESLISFKKVPDTSHIKFVLLGKVNGKDLEISL